MKICLMTLVFLASFSAFSANGPISGGGGSPVMFQALPYAMIIHFILSCF